MGGGRGGHRSTLSSWRRRRSPNYYSRAGRRGHPGLSRAAPRERPHAAAWPRRVRTALVWEPEARGQGGRVALCLLSLGGPRDYKVCFLEFDGEARPWERRTDFSLRSRPHRPTPQTLCRDNRGQGYPKCPPQPRGTAPRVPAHLWSLDCPLHVEAAASRSPSRVFHPGVELQVGRRTCRWQEPRRVSTARPSPPSPRARTPGRGRTYLVQLISPEAQRLQPAAASVPGWLGQPERQQERGPRLTSVPSTGSRIRPRARSPLAPLRSGPGTPAPGRRAARFNFPATSPLSGCHPRPPST